MPCLGSLLRAIISWSSVVTALIFAFLVFFAVHSGSLLAADPAAQAPAIQQSEAFREQSDRLRSLVYARPRATATFDRWFQLYAQAGAKNEFKELVEASRRDLPTDPSAVQVAGLLYTHLREWPEAEEAWQAAHRLSPEDFFPLVQLAAVQLRRSEFERAAESFEMALQRKMPAGDYSTNALQLVTLYQRLAQNEKAARWLSELSARAGTNLGLRRDVALRYEQLGMLAESRESWLGIADQKGVDAELRFEAQLQSMQLSGELGESERATSIGRSLLSQVDPHGTKAAQLRSLITRQVQCQGPQAAAQFWQAFCQDRPGDVYARAAWADALSRAGDKEQSLAIYRELLVRSPKDRTVRQAYVELLTREGDLKSAGAQLEELARQDPSNVEWLMKLAEARLRIPADDAKVSEASAVATWRQAMQLKPRDASVAREAADRCHAAALGNAPELWDLRPRDRYPAEAAQQRPSLWAAAEAFYREALRRDPSVDSRRALATLLHRLRRDQDAVAVWLDPQQADRSAADWLEAADHLKQLGYSQAALSAAEKAVAAQASSQAAWDQRIELTLAESKYAQAMQLTQQMLAVRPQDTAWKLSALDWRVRITIAAREVDARLKKLEEFIASRPQDRDAAWERLLLLQATGQWTADDPLVRRWLESPPPTPAERLRWADLLREGGKLEQASKLYRESLSQRGPQRKITQRRIVEVDLQRGDLAAAREAAEGMAREMPRDAEAQLLLAAVAARQSDLDSQVQVLEQAARLIPRDVTIRRQYASALQQQGQVALAIQQALMALDQSSSISEKESLLSWMLEWVTEAHDRANVRQHLEAAVAQASGSQQASFSDALTFWLERTGELELAQQELASQFLQRPLDIQLLERLVDVSDRAGKLEDAIRYQRQLAIVRPSPAVQERLARLYRQNGQSREALEIWDRLTDYRGTEQEALQVIDELLERPDLLAAQRLSEAALTRHSSSWQLAVRAALLHVALDQPAAASRELARVLRWPSDDASDASVSSVGTADVPGDEPAARALHMVTREVGFLQWSATVDQRLRVARWKQLQSGRQRTHEPPRLFGEEIMDALCDASPNRSQVVCALVARHWLAAELPAAILREWAVEERATSGTQQAIAIADWLQGEGDMSVALLHQMLREHPESGVPHLLQILRFGKPELADADWRADVATSLAWVGQQSPLLADELIAVVAARVASTPADPARDEWIAARLREANTIKSIARWMKPLLGAAESWPQVWRSGIREKVETHARRAMVTTTGIVPAQDWQVLLSAELSEMQQIPGNDKELAYVARLVRGYVNAPEVASEEAQDREERARRSGPFLSQRGPRVPKNSWRDLKKALQSLASLESTLRDRTAIQQNAALGQGPFLNRAVADDLLRLSSGESSAVIDRTIRYNEETKAASVADQIFPTSDAWWSVDRLVTLNQVTSSFQTAGVEVQDRFLSLLKPERGEQTDDKIDRADLAPALMLWWWNRRDDCLEQLQALSTGHPNVSVYRWNYARALLQSGQVEQAYEQLRDRSPDQATNSSHSEDLAEAAERLKLRQIAWKLWSNQWHRYDLMGHEGAVTALAMQPGGTMLASVGVDGKARLWDTLEGTLRSTLLGHEDMIMSVQFAPDGKLLYTGGYDRIVRRWKVENGESMEPLMTHSGVIRALACSPDGRLLASGDDSGQMRVAEIATGEIRMERSQESAILSLVYLASGDLAVLGQNGQVRIWKADGTERVKWTASIDRPRAMVRTSADDRLCIAGESGEIECWQLTAADANEWTRVAQWEPQSAIRGLAFAPQSATLAVGSDDHLVHLWQLSPQQERCVLQGHLGRVLAVALTDDGSRLASASLDGMIKIWELPSQESNDGQSPQTRP